MNGFIVGPHYGKGNHLITEWSNNLQRLQNTPPHLSLKCTACSGTVVSGGDTYLPNAFFNSGSCSVSM